MKFSNLVSIAIFAFLLASAAPQGHAAERRRVERRERDERIDNHELKSAVEAELTALANDPNALEDRGILALLNDKFDKNKNGKLDNGEIAAELHKIKEKHPKLYERILKRIKELEKK